jgi:hypothetical protein
MRTTNTGTQIDSMIYLFDDSGRGVVGNDDCATSVECAGGRSEIGPGFLQAGEEGIYFVSVNVYFFTPLDDDGLEIWDPQGGINGGTQPVVPDGPASGNPIFVWDGVNASNPPTGIYQIDLTGASFGPGAEPVPALEPGLALMLVMVLAGLAGMELVRRRGAVTS